MKKIAAAGALAFALLLIVFTSLGLFRDHSNDAFYVFFNACQTGDLKRVQISLANGAKINQASARNFGFTPLIAAIVGGNTNVVEFLVQSGADVNLPSEGGRTPLMWLAESGDQSLPWIKYLIAHGARTDLKDTRGASVLDYAQGLPPAPQTIEFLQHAIAQQQGTN